MRTVQNVLFLSSFVFLNFTSTLGFTQENFVDGEGAPESPIESALLGSVDPEETDQEFSFGAACAATSNSAADRAFREKYNIRLASELGLIPNDGMTSEEGHFAKSPQGDDLDGLLRMRDWLIEKKREKKIRTVVFERGAYKVGRLKNVIMSGNAKLMIDSETGKPADSGSFQTRIRKTRSGTEEVTSCRYFNILGCGSAIHVRPPDRPNQIPYHIFNFLGCKSVKVRGFSLHGHLPLAEHLPRYQSLGMRFTDSTKYALANLRIAGFYGGLVLGLGDPRYPDKNVKLNRIKTTRNGEIGINVANVRNLTARGLVVTKNGFVGEPGFPYRAEAGMAIEPVSSMKGGRVDAPGRASNINLKSCLMEKNSEQDLMEAYINGAKGYGITIAPECRIAVRRDRS